MGTFPSTVWQPNRLATPTENTNRPFEQVRRNLYAMVAQTALGVAIDATIPEDPKSVNWSTNHGRPILLETPSAKVSRALAEPSPGS